MVNGCYQKVGLAAFMLLATALEDSGSKAYGLIPFAYGAALVKPIACGWPSW